MDFTGWSYKMKTSPCRGCGKPMADGPRYKMLGNSMTRDVMEWIGKRIQAVNEIIAPELAQGKLL